jgi:uncharacterized protein (TIGR00661 family)
MARIYFSMSGEGRGHATRVRAMVDRLLERGHRIGLFAPGDAYELLAPVYAHDKRVRVRRLPGLHFYYAPNRKLDYLRTGREALGYLLRLPSLVRRLERVLRREKPDLVVTDFEGSLPRAAKRAGIPFLSINHQHFLVVNDLSELPAPLRRHTLYMGWIVRLFYWGQAETVVSQFYFPPVKKSWQGRVVQAGVLLRPELESATPTNEGFVVAYLRKFGSANIMAALRLCGRRVKLYGLGERPASDNIEYCAIDDRQFIRDLAACEALVCTAGNQLVGEALYLGKPVFGLPEANNAEQYINAWYLKQSGCGRWAELEEVTPDDVRAFLDDLEPYRARIDRDRMNGTPVALATIERHLAKKR